MEENNYPILEIPRNCAPNFIDTPEQYDVFLKHIPPASSPCTIAIDTERAPGNYYTAHVEIVQIKIPDVPIAIIDTRKELDFSRLNAALAPHTWIAHAAEADMLSLQRIGVTCSHLFDTELAGRFLGFNLVNLAHMTRECLGLNLIKGKAHEDWSQRPISAELLNYAALDVELLHELQNSLAQSLATTGKTQWFEEECNYLLSRPAPAQRKFHWSKAYPDYKQLAPTVKEALYFIWQLREHIAYTYDVFPQKLCPDESIICWALHYHGSISTLTPEHLKNIALPEELVHTMHENAIEFSPSVWKSVIGQKNKDHKPPQKAINTIKERKKNLLNVLRAVAEAHSLDPILFISRQLTDTLSKNMTVTSPPEMEELLHRCHLRHWQIELLLEPLTAAFVNL